MIYIDDPDTVLKIVVSDPDPRLDPAIWHKPLIGNIL